MNDLRRLPLLLLLGVILFLPAIPAARQTASTQQYASFTVRGASAAPQSSMKSFVVTITGNGFDNGTLDIVVNQGDTVQITFTMDKDQQNNTSPDNHHVIAISGYGLKTADVSPINPSATVTFVADKLGTFSIRCATPECPIHYLMLSGALEVVAPGQAVTTTTAINTSTQTTSATSSVTVATSGASSSVSTASAGIQTMATTATSQSVSATSSTTQPTTVAPSSASDTTASRGGVPFSQALVTAVATLIVGLIAGTTVASFPRPARR